METQARALWEDAKHRLQSEIARPVFESWVRHTQGVALGDGEFVVLVGNEYAREQIAGEKTIARLAGEMAGVDRVRFVTASEWEAELDASPSQVAHEPHLISLRPVHLSRYDEIVHPERAVSVPRYYLRLLAYLGLDLAWIPVAFRQVAYFRGLAFEPGDSLQCSMRELALWAGMTRRNLFRRINDPRLGWFVRRSSQEPQWSVGQDGIPHRDALTWDVILSMPLTPADQASLEGFLLRRLAQGDTASQAVKAAYQLPVEDLLPWPNSVEIPDEGIQPMGVDQVVARALRADTDQPALRKVVDALAYKVAGYGEPVEISHYFIRTWLPKLSPGEAWLVHYLRALAAGQRATNEVTIAGGHPALARRLGVAVKTIQRWLSNLATESRPLGLFVHRVRLVRHGDRSVDLTLVVRPEEPIHPDDLSPASGRAGEEALRQSVTHVDDPEGHSVTHDETPHGQSVTLGGKAPPSNDRSRPSPSRHSVTHDPAPQGQPVIIGPVPHGQSVTHAIDGEGQSVIHDPTVNPDNLSPLKGGGGLSTPTQLDPSSESSSSFDGDNLSSSPQNDTHGAKAEWDLKRLLQLASVHPAKARELEGASAEAWVSWLLYWASPAGAKLNDPIGHTISRMQEAPHTAMGGSYARLAAMGPKRLEALIAPRILNPWAPPPEERDWTDVMRGSETDRLRRLVDLLELDLEAGLGLHSEDWNGHGESEDDVA